MRLLLWMLILTLILTLLMKWLWWCLRIWIPCLSGDKVVTLTWKCQQLNTKPDLWTTGDLDPNFADAKVPLGHLLQLYILALHGWIALKVLGQGPVSTFIVSNGAQTWKMKMLMSGYMKVCSFCHMTLIYIPVDGHRMTFVRCTGWGISNPYLGVLCPVWSKVGSPCYEHPNHIKSLLDIQGWKDECKIGFNIWFFFMLRVSISNT